MNVVVVTACSPATPEGGVSGTVLGIRRGMRGSDVDPPYGLYLINFYKVSQ